MGGAGRCTSCAARIKTAATAVTVARVATVAFCITPGRLETAGSKGIAGGKQPHVDVPRSPKRGSCPDDGLMGVEGRVDDVVHHP